jgi:hypothetical protein
MMHGQRNIKNINTVCGQNVEFVNVNQAVLGFRGLKLSGTVSWCYRHSEWGYLLMKGT